MSVIATRVVRALMMTLVSMAVASIAVAQDYPSETIKIVVPYPPGGNSDFIGRITADKLAEQLGVPVVVENRPGATGSLGVDYVARSKPDGYTMALAATPQFSSNIYILGNVPYDPYKDLAPVSHFLNLSPIWLVANSSLPVGSLADLVQYAKERPGKLSYGSGGGKGTTTHVAMEQLKREAGIEIEHVPYPGQAPQLQALVAGEIDLALIGTPGPTEFVEAGQLKVLASISSTRGAPDESVPTMTELGYPDVTFDVQYGYFVPAGTPDRIVEKLATSLSAIAKDPDVVAQMKARGNILVASTPSEFAEVVKQENVRWHAIAKQLDLLAK